MDINALRQLMEEQLKLSRKLKARVQELEAAQRAPLAVVGMGLRLPGGLTTPEAYWDFLQGSELALSEVPSDRQGLRAVYDPRPDQPGRSYVNRAGFLKDVASFDASFFGISQREAEALDPQQRLLLETTWEAMERAGIAVRRQDRLKVGVFIGIMASEYGQRIADRGKNSIDPYFMTGGGHCFAAGRISYIMGFSGPAVSTDTACSSSLVSFHLGVQSLRRGECRYAVVGGSNLILSSDLMVALCQSKALAPDGRSKAFMASANGYGRGEGVGVMVLMRLDEAEREKRPILAVVRGSAVNHDGASSGLTVPSGPAQQEVIRAAIADAGVAPEEVAYVEAHGTGTSLGDPIEVGALDAVLGTGAPQRRVPLAVGGVKARIGHLEAAAGITGLMKLVLMLNHGVIPATLSDADGALNPLIAWDRLKVTVPRKTQAWPADFARRIAGISAFGLSGTNAHAVLEAYEAKPVEAHSGARRELLTLSAKDVASLKELAGAVGAYLATLDPALLPSVCHTLRAGRASFAQRLAITGTTPAELAQKLAEAIGGGARLSAMAPVMVASLRVGPASDQIAQGVSALTSAFPQLVQALEGAAAKPEAQLERILQRFGVRVKIVPDAKLVEAAARLEWSGNARPLMVANAAAAPSLLLDVLAALFVAGADLRLDALQAPGARFLDNLPTYAFRRKRFWIDEPSAEKAAPAPKVESSEKSVPGGPVDAQPQAVTTFLVNALKSVLHADEEFDLSQTFIGVGGDSFAAMMLKKNIEQHYQVDVPFDDFMVDMPLSVMIDRLGGHIARASGG